MRPPTIEHAEILDSQIASRGGSVEALGNQQLTIARELQALAEAQRAIVKITTKIRTPPDFPDSRKSLLVIPA